MKVGKIKFDKSKNDIYLLKIENFYGVPLFQLCKYILVKLVVQIWLELFYN